MKPSYFWPVADIPRALQLPDDAFKTIYGVDKPDEDKGQTIFYCMQGPRSYGAMHAARVLGYSRLVYPILPMLIYCIALLQSLCLQLLLFLCVLFEACMVIVILACII